MYMLHPGFNSQYMHLDFFCMSLLELHTTSNSVTSWYCCPKSCLLLTFNSLSEALIETCLTALQNAGWMDVSISGSDK